MSEQAKILLLVSVLVTLAFMFGIEVGAFEERQRRAYSLALRVVSDVRNSLAPTEPEPSSSGSGPED